MFRKTSSFMIAMVAVAAAACSPTSLTPAADGSTNASQGPVVNQAKIYASRVTFSKGATSGQDDSQGSDNSQCSMPDSLVLDVGSKGGSFSLNGSSFVVPKNALNSTVHMVMVPQLDSTVAVQFYPEGLVFNPNAQPTLTLNTDCIGDPANASIVYTDSLGTILEHKKTKGKTANSITTSIAHFSRYAVAW